MKQSINAFAVTLALLTLVVIPIVYLWIAPGPPQAVPARSDAGQVPMHHPVESR